jgi:fused signal recognition particle receptor
MLFNRQEKPGRFFGKLKAAVTSTKANLVAKIEEVVRGKKEIDADLLDELESILIGADIGVETTAEILEKIRSQVDRRQIQDGDQLKNLIKQELRQILAAAEAMSPAEERRGLQVLMIVGVNGGGKTTTIGKLANLFRSDDKKVLICAADTFRAAAIEQLEVWGQRAGVEIIRQKPGADPSAVLFDSIAAAKAREIDFLIVDTAGRLHTKANLMRELEKMKRIAGREVPGAPHEVLLVIDAVTGQNGVNQAREFLKSAGVTGIVLTKLDGTAKGGVVVAIARELKVPIQYVGVGEKIDDLITFSSDQFIESLFEG